MGAVYCAEDEVLGITVAVKENLFLSDEYARQFQREARILASLRHTNLPRVIDYCAIEGQGQYLIMDYIEGEDLRQRIERLGTLPEKEAVLIGIAICDALAHLHSRRPPVVHRDIKPGNIKITPDGEVMLVDFGLAKLMLGSQATTTGARAMTPGYSPPEQYGTARTDARTDIYSLGATLYAALTGVIPEDALARATGKAQLTPIRTLQPKIRRSLAATLEKSLQIEPDDRFQTAEEMKNALIEAGELTHIIQNRLLVPPPPVEESEAQTDQEEDQEVAHDAEISRPRSRPMRKPAYVQMLLWLAGAAAVFVVGSFLVGNDFNLPIVFAGMNATPTLTVTAGASGEQPVNETELPGVVPSTDSPSTPRSIFTPTLPGSPTQTPEIVPTPLGSSFGEISFTSDRTGSLQIWRMNSDGSQQRQLSNMPEGACQANWSPDGRKLAVISPCEAHSLTYEDSMIYIMNADGSNAVALPVSLAGDFDPAWSPDGNRIAFTSIRSGRPHIYVYNFLDSTLQELSDTRYADMQPTWNPSGKQLAFVREMPFNHIWIMSDMGQTQFQFSPSGNVNDLWPQWSYDGEFIIYSRSQLSPIIPWLLRMSYQDRGTGIEARIPPVGQTDPGPVAEPSLSPDIQWLVFESWPDGKNHDIYRMTIDGREVLRLTADPGLDFDPSWRPGTP
ncbi:MAG: protein kinase [Chloroflexi bacterium]|nr:protein kinase [Chloroflexota bacterium]